MTPRGLSVAIAAFVLIGLAPARAADAIPDYVTASVADPARPPDDMARDAGRKPAALVAFSQIKTGDVIADFVPGGGYYTRILSKVVGPKGRVYAFVPMSNVAEDFVYRDRAAAIAQGETPTPLPQERVLAIQDVHAYRNVTVLWESLGAYGGQFGVPEQLDAVWITDNYHVLHTSVMATQKRPLIVEAVNREILASLKPGGIYFIADYRAADGGGFSGVETLDRVGENAVKAELAASGFVLDGESDLLVNPDDDRTKPVGTARDTADQFVLRFKKPLTATAATLRPPHGSMDGYYDNSHNAGYDAPNERWLIYHADGTYQEWGNTGALAQEGLWFWSAGGRACLLHQFPIDNRGSVVCHPILLNMKAGDVWVGDNNRSMRIISGMAYPKPERILPCEPISCRPPDGKP